MKLALKELYLHNNADLLHELMNQAEIKVEIEVNNDISNLEENIGSIEDKSCNENNFHIDKQLEVGLNVENIPVEQYDIHMQM